ncbi:MAG: hypothetical protein KDD35_10595, partial [Bdellovibrionales bacterium]|nr:hypothetical protein [Bdellovibrionales bacterium]
MESSPSSKKKIVFSITGLSITCLILLVLWLYLKEKSNLTPFRDQNDISLEPYLEIKPGFHPDSVLKFGYHTKSFHQEYSRSSRDQDWTPAVYPQRVQKILNLLTQIHFKKLPPMKKPLVTLTVEFSNQQSWKAGWDGTHLQWLTGSYSGFGSQLNAADRILMLGGSLSFFPREYNWCPTRPTAFEFLSKKGSSLSLLHIQGEWLRSPSGLNQGKRDRSFGLKIENWLGLYCDLEIEQAIDIDY